MMHIVAGYPTLGASEAIARQILKSGADFLEIQIPFSDPIADGPLIASANEAALKAGMTVQKSLELIGRVARFTDKPIFIMTYFNIIYRYGVAAFCKIACQLGVAGLIVPDFPFDEEPGNQLLRHCRQNELDFVPVIALNTCTNRLEQILKIPSPFIYCVARAGTTGGKTVVSAELISYLQRVRHVSDKSLMVGFGLSKKSQIVTLEPYADIVVIGSALMREYGNIEHFIHSLLFSPPGGADGI